MKPAEMTFLGLNQPLIFYSVGNTGREREREEEREGLREGAELEDLFNWLLSQCGTCSSEHILPFNELTNRVEIFPMIWQLACLEPTVWESCALATAMFSMSLLRTSLGRWGMVERKGGTTTLNWQLNWCRAKRRCFLCCLTNCMCLTVGLYDS